MRGKRVGGIGHGLRIRIIPARAGQTQPESYRRRSTPDHPRACGANPVIVTPFLNTAGSSPRVRGKQFGRRLGELPDRIIPARAGQTASSGSGLPAASDHPRACGASPGPWSSDDMRGGSSPRVRGKRWRRSGFPRRVRIIPARARQTADGSKTGGGFADHPRACGANQAHQRAEFASAGSSPRVRGKRTAGTVHGPSSGIIPARAGQTPAS